MIGKEHGANIDGQDVEDDDDEHMSGWQQMRQRWWCKRWQQVRWVPGASSSFQRGLKGGRPTFFRASLYFLSWRDYRHDEIKLGTWTITFLERYTFGLGLSFLISAYLKSEYLESGQFRWCTMCFAFPKIWKIIMASQCNDWVQETSSVGWLWRSIGWTATM